LLDITTDSVANFPVFFLFHLSKYIGLQPQVNEGNSSYGSADLVNEPYADYNNHPSASQLIHAISQTEFTSFFSVNLSRNDRNKILDSLILHYQNHIDGFGIIHAHTILKEVLH
jgi:DNA repair protein RecO (recombination protein O)